MSKSEMATGERIDPRIDDLGRNRVWMLAIGLFWLVLGALGLAMLFGLTVVSIRFIGVLMLAGGAAQVLESARRDAGKSLASNLAIAVLYIAGGLVVLYQPASASTLLSLALGGVLAAIGIVRIAIARRLRAKRAGGRWMLLTGLAGVTLGVLIMLQWPLSGLFAIALFIAVDLLLQGVSTLWLAFRAGRRAAA